MEIRQSFLLANEKRNDRKVESRNLVFDQEISRSDLASIIVLHVYPLSIVDYFGFRRFQPMFKMVSRNTIKKDIFKVYDIEREKM